MTITIVENLAVLVLAAIAGFIGSIAGGGGLLTVPALILMGITPEVAIASSRAGAIGLWILAIKRYHKDKKVDWKVSRILALIGIAGGYIGSKLLIFAKDYNLNTIVAVLVIAMLPIVMNKKALRQIKREISSTRRNIGYFLFFAVMIFSGFFSGGDGTLGIFVLVICFGKTVVEANATRGPAWLAMGIVAVYNYYQAGILHPSFSIMLFIGMAIGGHFGASTALKKGENWVKAMLSVVVICLALKLLFIN